MIQSTHKRNLFCVVGGWGDPRNKQISSAEVQNSRETLKFEWSEARVQLGAGTGTHGMFLNFPAPLPNFPQSADSIFPMGRRLEFYFLKKIVEV